MKHLSVIVASLRNNNLVANPVKTALARKELELLGYSNFIADLHYYARYNGVGYGS